MKIYSQKYTKLFCLIYFISIYSVYSCATNENRSEKWYEKKNFMRPLCKFFHSSSPHSSMLRKSWITFELNLITTTVNWLVGCVDINLALKLDEWKELFYSWFNFQLCLLQCWLGISLETFTSSLNNGSCSLMTSNSLED